MKSMYIMKTNTKSYLWIALVFSFSFSLAQNNSVTIGSTSTNNKAVLWLVPNGGGQGLLLPSITSAQRAAMNLQTTDAGMVLFDSDQNALFYWNGTSWVSLSNNGAPVITMSGDVTGPTTAAIVQAIQGNKIQAITPSDQQVLKWNNVNKQWEPAADNVGPIYTQGTGISISNNTISVSNGTTAGQVLMWNGTAWVASTISATETNPTVKAINGIVKSNGTTISAAGASDINTTLGSQAANNFYAAPNGSNGFPSFRTLTPTDVPMLNQNTTGSAATLTIARTIQTNLASTSSASFNGSANITPGVAGTLGTANGGTGSTSVTANTLIKGNATGTAQTASQLFDNGTNVGIGTTAPLEKLHINGATLLEQIAAPTTTTTNRLYNVSGNLFWNGTNISSNGWSLTGNNGINPATNFIGTLDTASLVFKVNGTLAGKISYNSSNQSLGYNSGSALKSSAIQNTFIGGNSGTNVSTGGDNTAIGYATLEQTTNGNYNTALGYAALNSNNTGSHNTGVGQTSVYSNTTGVQNTGLGSSSLFTNKTGSDITAIGYGADVTTDGLSNATTIGALAAVGSSNSLVLGSISGINGAAANTNVGIGTTTPQEKLDLTDGVFHLGQTATPTTTTDRLYNVSGNLFWNGTNISSNGWSLAGNNGTDPSTNFLGTIDAQPLIFRANNTEQMRIDGTTGNVIVNYNSSVGPPNAHNGNFKFTAYNGNGHPAFGVDDDGVMIGDINCDSDGNYFYTDFENTPGSFQFMNGNVGIGTTTPKNNLDVAGGTVVGSSYAGVNTAPSNGLLVQGNVGIGTTLPQGALDVTGNAYVSGNTFFGGATSVIGAGSLMLRAYKGANNYGGMYIDTNGGLPFYGYAQNGVAKVWTYTDATSSNWNLNFGGTDVFTVTSGGNVGIGTTTPTKAKLEVNSGIGYSFSSTYSILYSGGVLGPTTPTGTVSGNNSIYASAGIMTGTYFTAASDARIKHVLGQSQTDEDLATISKIKITDYKYIDTLEHGSRITKKVIAQELKEVYPNAVSYTTNFVPDIYKRATATWL